jgi:hypothetical protein
VRSSSVDDILSFFRSQWSVQSKNGAYTIRGLSTGKHLNYEGSTLRDGLKVIASDNERIWDINRDEHNHGAFR